tara:strand:- start:5828 stop:6286 length:459 start_codon:yes stop_codon:yes gene_type:complete
MASESGTPELKNHHRVKEEKLDSRGIFRRHRVIDQCLIDKLFLGGDIEMHQYAAAEMYMELLWRSGSFLRSASMERGVEVTGGDVERSISSRIMIISRARSVLRDKCSTGVMLAVDTCVGGNGKVRLGLLREGLEALAKHFGVQQVRDPRDI